MSVKWVIGKEDGVTIGWDGYVRVITVAYKDTASDGPGDWTHRTVERPTKNLVKLFHLEDTC